MLRDRAPVDSAPVEQQVTAALRGVKMIEHQLEVVRKQIGSDSPAMSQLLTSAEIFAEALGDTLELIQPGSESAVDIPVDRLRNASALAYRARTMGRGEGLRALHNVSRLVLDETIMRNEPTTEGEA